MGDARIDQSAGLDTPHKSLRYERDHAVHRLFCDELQPAVLSSCEPIVGYWRRLIIRTERCQKDERICVLEPLIPVFSKFTKPGPGFLRGPERRKGHLCLDPRSCLVLATGLDVGSMHRGAYYNAHRLFASLAKIGPQHHSKAVIHVPMKRPNVELFWFDSIF